MNCLKSQCRSPVACNGFGYCRDLNSERLFVQVWRDRSAYPKTKRNRDLDRPIIEHVFSMDEAERVVANYRRSLNDGESLMPFLRAEIYRYADWNADPWSAKPFRTIT